MRGIFGWAPLFFQALVLNIFWTYVMVPVTGCPSIKYWQALIVFAFINLCVNTYRSK